MLLTERVEIEELGAGQFRQTINLKPIAVREAGVLLAMNQSWADSGDGTTPHIVNRAPLRSRVANDGMRRLFPIPGDDTSYLEIGAPFIKLSGVWTQVSLGTPSRSAHVMTWTRPQTITRVIHFGHMVKLDIELRGGFVPEDSMIAFPVGIQNLTRTGTVISKNGTPVMQLRPLVVEDATNLDDVRPISHQFTNLGGNPYLLLTLPSLTGMTRPRIDPTLTLQPDATAGMDVPLQSNVSTRNFGVKTSMTVGEATGAAAIFRTLIKFDLSTLPSDATLDTNTLSLYATADVSANARTFRVYRQKRAWLEGTNDNVVDSPATGATWVRYDLTNNWSTAGGFHADDCEQTDIGSRAMTATETLNQFKDFVLTPTTKANLDLGNGWMVKADTESDDGYTFSSSDNATAADRPKFVSIYTEAGGGTEYEQSAAGTLTSAGTLARSTTKTFAGALTSSGALTRSTGKVAAGAITSTGALTRETGKVLAGTLTMAGALVTSLTFLVNAAGTLTSVGALVKASTKTFAGTLTSSGELLRSAGKALAGALTSTGSLLRNTGKILAGTLTSSGVLVTSLTFLVAIGGALTTAGALVRSTSKTLVGTLTMSGAIGKAISKAIAGTLSFLGTLIAAIVGGEEKLLDVEITDSAVHTATLTDSAVYTVTLSDTTRS